MQVYVHFSEHMKWHWHWQDSNCTVCHHFFIINDTVCPEFHGSYTGWGVETQSWGYIRKFNELIWDAAEFPKPPNLYWFTTEAHRKSHLHPHYSVHISNHLWWDPRWTSDGLLPIPKLSKYPYSFSSLKHQNITQTTRCKWSMSFRYSHLPSWQLGKQTIF